MLIIPAIDLKDGKCVRLTQGQKDAETVFSNNPVDVAKSWQAQGAKYIHVVDLDGAFEGKPKTFPSSNKSSRTQRYPSSLAVGYGLRKT